MVICDVWLCNLYCYVWIDCVASVDRIYFVVDSFVCMHKYGVPVLFHVLVETKQNK